MDMDAHHTTTAEMNEKQKSRLYPASGGLSQFFRDTEDEEMESPPQFMRDKWKKLVLKHSAVFEAHELVGDSKWQDIPMELLVRILALVDHRTVLVASGVCTGWRDALSLGILELSFSWCGKSVSMLVQSVAYKFYRLQSCNLRRCTLLNDQAVQAIARHCHDLSSLDLSNGRSSGTRLTDLSLVALANGCKLLQKLDLSGCIGITEAGLVQLAESCRQLKHLNLCGCDNAGSDNALKALAQNCVGLQILNAGWCDRITDEGISAMAIWCPDLRGVDLCGCHLISDVSVIALAEKCHRLRYLGLHCCRNITDLSMYSLVNSRKYRAQGSSGKKKLSPSGSGNQESATARSTVTRSSTGSCSTSGSSSNSSFQSSNDSSTTTSTKSYVQCILSDQDGYGLVSLNLSGCTALSGQAVQAVCDSFPALHTCPERHSLNVSGCTNLTSVHCSCVVDRGNRSAIASRLQQQ
ncbi:F-box protein SKP2A [Selaginella moellendorffii]|uniref:F-box protein SKP2A n=1 Tax=Selaginella moellendorffii TaxID=88036 RepID=UPI000D1CCF30|nr:F-box protein SKP2A [Selaginella moellendorffii]|eukprot:XP_024520761.1 F-box protein SKP2A [Selaginella moellendorffii]